MTPTLNGRIQTRIFVTLVIGGLWTLIITPVLPTGAGIGASYQITFIILLTVTVLGVGWELIYLGLQQFRWEKDWPTPFGLLTGINEGALIWFLIAGGLVPGIDGIGGWAFVLDFATTWVVIWLTVNGPMRIPFIRWRFRGGRLV